MFQIKTITMIMVAVAITACTGSAGDKFVGKWVNVGDPDITLEIEKSESGKSFKVTDRMTWMGKPKVSTHKATVADDSLMINTWAGNRYLMIEKDGTLLATMGRSCPKCDQWERAK